MKTTAELREGFLSFFEERGHTRFPSWSLLPPRGRSVDALHLGGDAAAEAVLLRGEGAARAALHHRAEGAARRREGHRPRRGRPDGAPRLDVRDARQLLVRRLLQGRRDRPRLGVRHRADGARPRPAVGDRLRRRPGARARARTRSRCRAGSARACRASGSSPSRAATTSGAPRARPGRAAPARSSISTAARSTAAGSRRAARTASTATATSSSGTSSSWSSTSHADGTLTPLPKQNIDTGMGLERGAMLLQGAESIFDTDGFRLIMDWIARESGVGYHDSPAATKAHRVISDHGRGMTFLVAEGVTPSNEGRGYVLRRLIRRAVVQARRIGLEDVYRVTGDRRRPGRAVVPGGGRAPRDRRAGRARRGGAVPRDARARAEGVRGARRHGGDHRRGGVHARGDARVPDRAHRRARGGARPGGRRRRLPRGDGAAPRDLARGRRHERRAGRRVQPHHRLPHGVRRLREDRRPDADRRARRARGRGASSRSCASRRSTRRAAAR